MSMLVLTRRPGQSIVLFVGAEKITMKFEFWAGGERARVSVTASDAVVIKRDELLNPPEPCTCEKPTASTARGWCAGCGKWLGEALAS